MPRSNWKGVISFGLVSIPIVLYPVENKAAEIFFHQIDKRDNMRIRYQRVNVNTGKTVPWDQITRAYEYDENTNIPVPDEVLKKVAGESARTISIETFIDKDDLNIMTISNSYYLTPGKGSDKGYVILREALKSSNKIGIAKVIISTKEYLSAVVPHENALILCLLRYEADIRKVAELDFPKKELGAYKINKKEIEMAIKLIKSMSTKWHPGKFKDEYQDKIHKWVEETVRHLPHTKPKNKHPVQISQVVNFVDLLKKSLETGKKDKKSRKKVMSIKTVKRIPHSGRMNHKYAVKH